MHKNSYTILWLPTTIIFQKLCNNIISAKGVLTKPNEELGKRKTGFPCWGEGGGLPSSFPLKTQHSKCLYPVSHGKNNKWYVTKTNSVNAQELSSRITKPTSSCW